jgi:hypothetical protein
VPHRLRISPFESTRIGLSRVRSQYFFNFCPTLFRGADRAKKSCAQSHLRGDPARSTQRLLLLQGVDVIVETDFGGGLIDEMPIDVAAKRRRAVQRRRPDQLSASVRATMS